MKLSTGLGGRGTVMESEPSKPHPNSHFEIGSMNIKKADDGSYVMEHRMELKKKFEGKDGFHGGYRDSMVHTAAGPAELMAHIKKHFGKSKEVMPKASDEDEAGERADSEDE